MAVEGDMRSALTADATVAALVGTRVYPFMAPQDSALPRIIYRRLPGGPLHAASGPLDTFNVHYEFDCQDDDYAGVKTLAAAVLDVLDGWSNTEGTPAVSSCHMVEESEGMDFRSDDSEDLVHVVTQEYSLWWS